MLTDEERRLWLSHPVTRWYLDELHKLAGYLGEVQHMMAILGVSDPQQVIALLNRHVGKIEIINYIMSDAFYSERSESYGGDR